MLLHLFVVKFIYISSIYLFCTMDIVLMAKVRLVVVVDDLDFRIKDFTFEAKVFNRYGIFNQMQIRV